jgi:ketosteroid isomerase-like protein
VAAAAGVVAALAVVPGHGSPPPPGGSLSSADAERLARSFARAYETEDPTRLARLLTADAQRVTPADRESGRSDVLAAYKRQFAQNETTGFTLSQIDSSGGAAARVTAHYRATYRGAPDTTGTIAFDTILERGKPKIALIAARPD